MKFGSVCSGIEAASCAWESLGWQAQWFSEIEPFPCAVLAHKYPTVPNFGDMTKFKDWSNDANIDVLVGGTPCQSFSVAGLRKGLDDPRGNLMLTYLAIANKYRPKWLVWENVPGVLSSGGGEDFASLLRGLGELGYGFAYRVLDAQYFGVAQRRRRVFVVGCFGDWRSAAAVLFERQSLSGNLAPSREKREITPTLTKECTGVSRTKHNEDGWYVPTIAKCLTRGISQRFDSETETMIPIALAENTIGRQPQNGGNGDGFTVGGPMYTLNATGVHGIAQPIPFGVNEKPDVGHCLRSGASKADKHESTTYIAQQIAQPMVYEGHGQDCRYTELKDVCSTVSAAYGAGGGNTPIATIPSQSMAVRRLTPVECERLQGFPDNYTNIPWRKKEESPDGPRYKALGNSMAVPVMKWIGQRIQQVELLK